MIIDLMLSSVRQVSHLSHIDEDKYENVRLAEPTQAAVAR